MISLEQEAGIYGASLVIFAKRRKLPLDLFQHPDHLTLTPGNIQSFGELVRDEIVPKSRKVACTEMDWRFKAAAKLRGRLAIYDLGFVDWVMVEESQRQGDETMVTSLAEFYCDSLEFARTALGRRGIRSKITPERNRAYINVDLDSDGLAFRFTNMPLSEIIEEQLESGEAILVSLGKKPSAASD